MGLLAGSVVFITGGSAGQGRAHALASAGEGADVVIVDVHPEGDSRYVSLQQEVESLGRRALCLQADVTQRSQLDAAVERAVREFGRLDGVIVNAGIYRSGAIESMDPAQWRLVMGVNLEGAWNTIAATAGAIERSGGGSVVIIASVDGLDPAPASTAYGVSKAGAIALARYAAAELGPSGIRVNAIAPGFVDTEMMSSQRFLDSLAGGEGLGTRQHLLDYASTKTVLRDRQIIAPDEIAKVALFLNSDLASAVTGAVLPVDAGYLLLPHAKKH